jgi:hypothetical protein
MNKDSRRACIHAGSNKLMDAFGVLGLHDKSGVEMIFGLGSHMLHFMIFMEVCILKMPYCNEGLEGYLSLLSWHMMSPSNSNHHTCCFDLNTRNHCEPL